MNAILPSIMQSIKPQYCELIAAGKKTIEVRKTRPKLKPPFKVYIYCTQPKEYFSIGYHMRSAADYLYMLDNGTVKFGDGFEDYDKSKIGLNGKVIGEYVCDRITPCVPIRTRRLWDYAISLEDEISCCLSHEQLREYGKCKTLYLWHITNLKIYDEPKELSEFYKPCPCNNKCYECKYHFDGYFVGDTPIPDECGWFEGGDGALTRPPQSWCYVEEVS